MREREKERLSDGRGGLPHPSPRLLTLVAAHRVHRSSSAVATTTACVRSGQCCCENPHANACVSLSAKVNKQTTSKQKVAACTACVTLLCYALGTEYASVCVCEREREREGVVRHSLAIEDATKKSNSFRSDSLNQEKRLLSCLRFRLFGRKTEKKGMRHGPADATSSLIPFLPIVSLMGSTGSVAAVDVGVAVAGNCCCCCCSRLEEARRPRACARNARSSPSLLSCC